MSKQVIAVGETPAAVVWTRAQRGARAFSAAGDPARLLCGTIAAADALVVLLSSAGADVLHRGGSPLPHEVATTTVLTAVLTVTAVRLAGGYTIQAAERLTDQIMRAAKAYAAVSMVIVVLAFLTGAPDGATRLWEAGFYPSVLVGIALVRLAAILLLLRRWRRSGRLVRIFAVVDLAGSGRLFARNLLLASGGDMCLAGVFFPESDDGQSVADLIALTRLFRIDDVFIATSGHADCPADRVGSTLRDLLSIPATVHLCPAMPTLGFAPRARGPFYGQPVLTLRHRPLMGWSRVVKRTEDLLLSVVAIVLLAPLMAIVAVLVKLDSPGPILFQQERQGFNNNVITVYKFRSMVHRPDPEEEVMQAQRDDPRVTRIGRSLRRLGIDELPQLFNVLNGTMSLVGPRPHAVSHNDKYAAQIDDYLARHRMQPGITGWAQVNGLRGETKELEKMKRRVEHDLVYIDSWSLLLDMRILLRTLFLPFFDRNAY